MSNRLAQSQSLYLRKHADNPIDWWFWCEEALETAKAQQKPIFLSIGYSSCHWCTVMEGEAFSDRAIADYMNVNFLPIKLDREERPDLDSIYMQALQMMTGQGGWPLNIFLTPDDLVPFYGGTYFPLEPRYGRPGFLQVLQSVRRFFDMETDKVQAFKQEILAALRSSSTFAMTSQEALTPTLLATGMETNTGVLTARGMGGPSFPMMPYAQLALAGRRLMRESPYDGSSLCLQRGKDLALGGIYDHVGGGFHRYTVDDTWTVPHFEKMLYDNGQIMEYLANLWSAGHQESAFERAIAGTVQWLKREMTAPTGYFYAAQDADSFEQPDAVEPEEGAFYVWRYQDLEGVLTPAELTALQANFTVTRDGNFEGANVLQVHGEVPSTELTQALHKLFVVRYGASVEEIGTFPPARNNQEAKSQAWPGRIPPVTDTKMIVSWNSLMISGLARAYAIFGEAEYGVIATTAALFILDKQWHNGRLHRLNYDGKVAFLAQSEDYALLIKALLDMDAAGVGNFPWLERAIQVQAEFDDQLLSIELGGYYNNAADDSDHLLIRERNYLDNATPAANGVAIANLARLAALTDDLSYLDRAEQALTSFAKIMEQSPQACPSLFSALDWFQNGQLVRVGETLLQNLRSHYFPTCAYRLDRDLPEGAIGLVCRGQTCLKPAFTKTQLTEQMKTISPQG